jgi:uncharacterized protein
MPSLPELQRRFACALQGAGREATPMFRGAPERNLPRLAVYRGNVLANATKALACAYPVVRKIVGEEFFDAMAREFAREHPSRGGDLNRYGEQLGGFLERFPHAADLPYLPDVARMEWLVHRAHYAADAPPFDASSLARLAPEDYPLLRPRLTSACSLLESAWPLERIWAIHQDDYQGVFEIDLHAGSDRILVHRPRWRAAVLSLAPGDFAFLNNAFQGRALGEALEAGETDVNFDPSTALARWIQAGVIASLV